MTRPVRPITAKCLAGLSVYATIQDAAGDYFSPATGLFTPALAGVPLAETDTPVLAIGAVTNDFGTDYVDVEGRLYTAPFPPEILAVGLYRVGVFQGDWSAPSPDDMPVLKYKRSGPVPMSYGRTIHPPDLLPHRGHYASTQPPQSSTVDLSLGMTRSLRHAWQMNGGTYAQDSVRPYSYAQNAGVGYTAATVDGRACALVSMPDDFRITFAGPGNADPSNGYLLKIVKRVRTTFTLLGSVNVPEGNTGIVLSIAEVTLRRTATGYALTIYKLGGDATGITLDQALDGIAPGWHRWALTYTAPSLGPDGNVHKPAVLSVYCDGLVLGRYTDGLVTNGNPTGGLVLGQPYQSFVTDLPPSCPANHENYQYHGRALTDEEIAQDALTPYACFVRLNKFPSPGL